MKKEDRSSSQAPLRYVLIYSILLLVFTAASFYFVLPYAKKNIEETEIKEHYRLYIEEKAETSTAVLTIPLYSKGNIVYKEREIDILGRDRLHLLLEALLLPLTAEEKSEELSSAIPEKTKLIGASEKNGYFFIELSKEFLQAEDTEKALSELRTLLNGYKAVKELTILSNGEIIR